MSRPVDSAPWCVTNHAFVLQYQGKITSREPSRKVDESGRILTLPASTIPFGLTFDDLLRKKNGRQRNSLVALPEPWCFSLHGQSVPLSRGRVKVAYGK